MAFNQAESWVTMLDLGVSAAELTQIAKVFDDWASPLNALVADGDVPPVLRPSHALAVGVE